MASGRVPILHALLLAPVLVLASFVIAWQLPPMFLLALLVYLVSTTLYSFSLKRVVMLDVIVLAGLYTLRIIGGALASDVDLSF